MSSNEVNRSCHIFTWKLKRFSLCSIVRGDSLRSPVFKAVALHETLWYLLFYPQGVESEEAEGHTGIYLCRDNDQVFGTVALRFSLAVINENEEDLFTLETDFEFEEGHYAGWSIYKEIDKFSEECVCFPSDTLILRCRMVEKWSESSAFSENVAETTIGCDRIAFDWDIPRSGQLAYKSFQFQCPACSEYEISLHIPQFDIVVTIEKLDKDFVNFKASFRMSLVGENGTERHLRMFDNMFEPGKDLWRIFTSIKKRDIFEQYQSYIKNDVVTIKCEFCAENWSESYQTYEYRGDRSVAEHLVAFKKEYTEPLACLQADLKSLFISSKSSDIVLKVGSEKVSAHKFILSARSPIFASMFRKRPYRYLDIPAADGRVLRKFVEYLYTGIAPDMDYDFATKMLKLACDYHIHPLIEECNYVLNEFH